MEDSIQPQDLSEQTTPAQDVLDEALERCEQERQEHLQGWQRARADYDNLARRLAYECDEAREQGTVRTIKMLAPLFDHLTRALAQPPAELRDSEWGKGLGYIAREWEEILQKLDVEKIKTVGLPFDPARHEALAQNHNTDQPDGIVLEEVESGYEYKKEKIIKVAKVIVNQL